MEEEKSPMVGMSEEEKEQYVSEQALAIIMSAGDARTIAKEAFDEIVAGNFEHAEELMHQADRKQVEAVGRNCAAPQSVDHLTPTPRRDFDHAASLSTAVSASTEESARVGSQLVLPSAIGCLRWLNRELPLPKHSQRHIAEA